MGLLRIRVKRGINLAVRDSVNNSSDPYVVVRSGKLKLKTRVIKKCLNPEWNDDLTLSIIDPNQTVKIVVYDKDRFSFDDKMGEAEFTVTPLYNAVNNLANRKSTTQHPPCDITLATVKPGRENCLAEESRVVWVAGPHQHEVVQNMFLRLRDVESGEVEIELRWTDVHRPQASTSVSCKKKFPLSL